MEIKFKILFYLQKVYNKNNSGECQIRMRVRWDDNIAQFNCGYSIHPNKWIADSKRCKRNTSNNLGHSASEINEEIDRLNELAIKTFKFYEYNDQVPTLSEFKDKFNKLNGKETGKEVKRTLDYYFLEFMKEEGTANTWADATFIKFNTLNRHIKNFDSNININGFNRDKLLSFLDYLRVERNMQNGSIIKMLKLLKWFLRWTDRKGYLRTKDYIKFAPKIKTVKDKQIVFLTWEELMKVYNFEFPDNKKYLDRARDVFCFECFTSLRYSDIAKLERVDITEDKINVVTKKTGDTLSIDINKYSRSILDKYKDNEKPLPVITNQKLNEYIKDVCFVAGIDTPTKVTYYRGSERIEEVYPKYQLIGTHTGRRTFISNALSMGIPASVVMSWTGHSDYKAMQPYIKIADDAKKRFMDEFNK